MMDHYHSLNGFSARYIREQNKNFLQFLKKAFRHEIKNIENDSLFNELADMDLKIFRQGQVTQHLFVLVSKSSKN